MADKIITELEEDLKNERINQFFQKNGKLLVALSLLVVISIGGYELWKYNDTNNRIKEGNKLYSFIVDFGPTKDPATLTEVQKNHTYKDVATLVEANLYQAKGEEENTLKTYERLAKNPNSNNALRQLAQLNVISMRLNKNSADSSVEADLQKLAADNGIFRYTAQEMLATYYQKSGKFDKSKEIFKKLSEDENAPRTLAGRAKSMLSSF
jgi:hypothetical protein